MIFHFFRLSLAENVAPPLLEAGGIVVRGSRAEFLAERFGSERVFPHYGAVFKYIKFGQIGPIIYGAIGREHPAGLRDDKFQPSDATGWATANLFIDTSGDSSGQKIAVQNNSRVGSPAAFLQSFVDYLNGTAPLDQWRMALFSMSNEADFWNIEKQYRGQISKVQFKFAVPNMLRSGDSLSEELREIGKEVRGQEVNLDITRPDGGLTLVNNLIKNAIAYVNAGAGQVILKVKKKIVYNSRKWNLRKDVDTDVDISVAEPKQVEDLSKKVFDQ